MIAAVIPAFRVTETPPFSETLWPTSSRNKHIVSSRCKDHVYPW